MFASTRLLTIAAVMASLSIVPAFAQVSPSGPTVGPAGGVATTTSPSNSEGTPAGGTGVVGNTRVGPSTVRPVAPMATTPTTASTSAPARRHRVYHRRRVAHPAPATEVGTQSQAGTNGSVAPAAK